jgi:hypothetical protein
MISKDFCQVFDRTKAPGGNDPRNRKWQTIQAAKIKDKNGIAINMFLTG